MSDIINVNFRDNLPIRIVVPEAVAPKGRRGNGIASITFNSDYTMTITDDDGNPYTSGSLRGPRGAGISEVIFDDEEHTMTVTNEDGNSWTSGSLQGPQGKPLVWNIIDGTMYPDVSARSKYPKITGLGGGTGVSYQATVTASIHGVRITTTNANMAPAIVFGAGNYNSNGGLVYMSNNMNYSNVASAIRPGGTYTLSFDGKWKGYSGYTIYDNRYMPGYVIVTVTDNSTGSFNHKQTFNVAMIDKGEQGTDMSGKCECTFTIPEGSNTLWIEISVGRVGVQSDPSPYKAGDYLELNNLKLEEGTEATPWAPCYNELKGAKGDKGNGIKSISFNQNDYTMTITDDENTPWTSCNLRGPIGETGRSIVSFLKTATDGLVDTWTITYSIGDPDVFTVTNGAQLVSVQKTAESGITATWTMTFSDGNTYPFTVTNGTTFTPNVSQYGLLSWTNNGGLQNPESVDVPALVRNVYIHELTGANPIIYGLDNNRYICGTVESISITPPTHGIVDVVFTSGTTPAVLVVPSAVKFPEWFDSTSLDTETVYEINIVDGIYGAVMMWPV